MIFSSVYNFNKKNMRKLNCLIVTSLLIFSVFGAKAQYKNGTKTEKTKSDLILEEVQNSDSTLVISLKDAITIALSESTSIKVADKEVEKMGYAKQGSYSALFPQISAVGNYQRVIKKQVMYMDFKMPSMPGDGTGDAGDGAGDAGTDDAGADGAGAGAGAGASNGIEIGRSNTYSAGISANMSLINAQVWQGIKISGLSVDLAVEKARASRIDKVGEVKKAYYSVLLSKEAFEVYKEVYENAIENFKR